MGTRCFGFRFRLGLILCALTVLNGCARAAVSAVDRGIASTHIFGNEDAEKMRAMARVSTKKKSMQFESSQWDIIYNGFGKIEFGGDYVTLIPARADYVSSTHACLINAKETNLNPLSEFYVKVGITNLQQLRTGSAANPWEVFWLLFNFQNEDHVSAAKFNYLIFKLLKI